MRNDLSIYSEFADEWWQPGSRRFRSLQNISPFRLEIIQQWCGDFKGKKIADLGCGGGLLAIPMIEDGGEVTGVDLSPPSINAAKAVSKGQGDFLVADVRSLPLPSDFFDMAVIADVLDHVQDYESVLNEAARIVKPGGKIFIGTINRTWRAWFFAIFLGEGLGLIPKGTHDYKLFIRPAELTRAALSTGLKLERFQGEAPRLYQSILQWSVSFKKVDCLSVAYLAMLSKPEKRPDY